jgi:hypothetical protein
MRKLGEQWVEEIDGKEHMLKAVKQTNKCSGCVFCTSIWCADHNQSERDFDCMTMIIKDLGILNEDGLLPCPFCGEYPEIKYGINGDGWHYVELSCCKYVDRMSGYSTDMEGFFRGMIERWNRRV